MFGFVSPQDHLIFITGDDRNIMRVGTDEFIQCTHNAVFPPIAKHMVICGNDPARLDAARAAAQQFIASRSGQIEQIAQLLLDRLEL